jgi:DNA ligase (NAD+)
MLIKKLRRTTMNTERIEELEREIEKHNHLYWEKNEPIINDESYDVLLQELLTIYPDSHIFTTLEEQKSIEPQNKYVHSDPMLSLEKFYSVKEVITWMKKIGRSPHELFKMELKLDGISGRLENGNLATRGDGRVGENHTSKIPFIEFKVASDKTICETVDCTINGEIIITDKFFEDNLKGEFKNSRNAVAGLMGRKRPEEIEGMGVTFVDFDYDKIQHTGNVDAFEIGWDDLVKNLTSKGFPFDGIVIKLADTDYYKLLGNKTKSPRGAIAFKFANKKGITPATEITAQVSRKGKLTPVAELEPIELAGVTISRATCHNFKFVKDMGIGKGSVVVIERAGDVIPKITSVVKGKIDDVIFPTNCPCCDTPTEFNGVDLCCPNTTCPDRLIEHLAFMAKTIGIDELGRPTAEKIYNYYVESTHNKTNIFRLNSISYEDILSLEGYGEKSAKTLYGNIQNALKNINEIDFLASFGISGWGKTMADKALTKAGSLDNLLKMNKEELTSIEGIGEIMAENLINGVKEQCIRLVHADYTTFIVEPTKEHNNIVDGQHENIVKYTICFTGKLENPRKFYENIAKERGMKPTSSVNKDLNILITADKNSVSSKMKKAEKLGIEILSLEEWL